MRNSAAPRLRAALVAGCAILPLLAAAAQAQDGAPDSAAQSTPERASAQDDNAIIVTALRRESTLQDTPLAISAFTGEGLARANINDAYELTRVTPGLVIRESANGGARVTLRNINAAGEPVVGVYYDETPLVGPVGVNNDAGGASPDVRLFDVERVEVLRGPQGTLYGSASMAGTVRLIFAKPDLYEAEGATTARVSTIDGGKAGYEVQGMASTPISEGLVGLRVVSYYRDRGGWLDNSWRGEDDINDAESYGGRAMLRFQPADTLTIDGLAAIQRYSGFVNNWLYKDANGALDRDYDAAWLTNHRNSDEFDLFSLTASQDFGFATLVGTISHQRRALSYTSDSSNFFIQQQANAARCRTFQGITAACSPGQLEQYRTFALSQSPSAAFSEQETTANTQELRLSSNGGSMFNWTVGFYHSERHADVRSDVSLADTETGDVIFPQTETPRVANGQVIAPATVIFRRSVDDTLEETAVYGEGSLEPIDGFTLTVGTRYYDYSKKVTGGVQIGNLIIGSATSPYNTQEASNNGFVWKFGAAYEATPDLLIYGEAAEGFRPGGVNQVIGLPAEFAPYDPDSLWNYELGVKAQPLDGLTINANIYQIDWKNMQISGQTNAQSTGSTFSIIANAGDARIRGAELEVFVEPTDGLSLRASGSYNDAVLVTDQITNFLNASGREGDKVLNTPEWTLQGGAEYVRAIYNDMVALAKVDATYTGTVWDTFGRTDALTQRLPGYTELSARLGIEAEDGGWGAYLYGTNLLNELGVTSKGEGTLFGAGYGRAISLVPRTIGIELQKRF
jgi:iron complex outermembrane recepter protein